MKSTGTERVPKDFDEEDYLTLKTSQFQKYLFRRKNEEQGLSICVLGKTKHIFKGSDAGISCEKPIVVGIFEEGESKSF